MKPFGLILAGGRSSRMVVDKAFVELNAKTLLGHVYGRLLPQCNRVLVSTHSHDPRFAEYETVADTIQGQLGPLAGILAGLEHIEEKYERFSVVSVQKNKKLLTQHNHEWLVTIPVDCPFMPINLVEKFINKTRISSTPFTEQGIRRAKDRHLSNKLVLARSNTQIHYTTGLWHISLIEPLKYALKNGVRKMQDFTKDYNPASVEWETTVFDPFFNINTQADLSVVSAFLNSASASPI